MATKNKIINIKVFFDGDQDASQVFAEVIRTENKGHEKERLSCKNDR